MCLDLQVIDNIPGAKVEEDMETHHFLTENLYKPRRQVTHVYAHIQYMRVIVLILGLYTFIQPLYQCLKLTCSHEKLLPACSTSEKVTLLPAVVISCNP